MEEKYQSPNDEMNEIDLKLITKFFFRHKNIIAIFALIGSIFGYLRFINTPKVWQGEFQIVVAKKGDSNNLIGDSALIGGIIKEKMNNEIETQIIILKSPSVLMDTFNFVKKKNKEDELRFEKWKKRLDVKQLKNSSVLSIKYADNNKEIILPVLDKISYLYQDYSNNKRLKSIDLQIKYYKEQVKKYTALAYDSLLKTQDYSEKYAISPTSLKENEKQSFITDVEENSSQARMLIKEIDQRLKKIKSISNNEEFIYYAKFYKKSKNLLDKLGEIDNQIIIYSARFNDIDPILIDLRSQRELIKNKLGLEIISILEAEKDAVLGTLEANKRESNVVFNFKKLLLEGYKNSNASKKLEGQLLLMELEKARNSEPWDLITKPSLLPSYILPSKIKYILGGFLTTFIGINLFLLYIEKINKFVTRNDEIISLLKINKYFVLSPKNKDIFKEKLDLFKFSLKDNLKNKVTLYGLENKENITSEICDYLNNNLSENKYFISKKVSDLTNFEQIVVITSLNETKKSSIIEFKNNLEILKIKLLGLIIIDDKDIDIS